MLINIEFYTPIAYYIVDHIPVKYSVVDHGVTDVLKENHFFIAPLEDISCQYWIWDNPSSPIFYAMNAPKTIFSPDC